MTPSRASVEASPKEKVVDSAVLEPPSSLTLSRARPFPPPTPLIARFRRGLELPSIGRMGDVIVFEWPTGREGEVTGERTFSSSHFFSDFEGVECSLGWTFSLSRTALPFSIRRTSSETHAVDDESSGDEPTDGFDVFVSSSPLDEGEGRLLSLLGGGASKATSGFTTGVEFVLEATDAAERRLLSAVAKMGENVLAPLRIRCRSN